MPMCGSDWVLMRTRPLGCTRKMPLMSLSCSICAHVVFAKIIISLTSVSIGEPRSRRVMRTLPCSSNSMP